MCVDTWVVEIMEGGPLGLRAAQKLLAAHQCSPAEHCHRADDRARSLVGQAALLRLVTARTRRPPRALTITRDERGRPVVLGSPEVRVSLSHSGAFVACAASSRDVGIDIERGDRVEADAELARYVCTAAERDWLEARPAEEGRHALVRLWVRKEALAKALGVGFGLPFATVDVRSDMPKLAGGFQRRWTIRDLDAPDGYLAAVAARGRSWSVRPRLYARANRADRAAIRDEGPAGPPPCSSPINRISRSCSK
jgi:4'-phosphopantetheinyl transferase